MSSIWGWRVFCAPGISTQERGPRPAAGTVAELRAAGGSRVKNPIWQEQRWRHRELWTPAGSSEHPFNRQQLQGHKSWRI